MPAVPEQAKSISAASGVGPARVNSNSVGLSPREWLAAALIAAAAFWLVPLAWEKIEPFKPGPDYRIPYSLGEDYWMYRRWCREACRRNDILVVGDSVVWGHYVPADQTLPHYLSQLAGHQQFANLGVDGIHPAALAGLLQYYARDLVGQRVLLFCNPLWMSSRQADLQSTPQARLNHPRLIPQFSPRIPAYNAPLEDRLTVVVQRNMPFLGWVGHIRIACFDSRDIAAWTLEHPYASPLRAIALELPSGQQPPPDAEPEPWTAQGIEPYSPQWVDLQTSIQWGAFQRTLRLLQSRQNRVFVLIGPFNEHMLQPDSLVRYRRLKGEISAWLREGGIRHFAPAALPSDLYADASHPLAAGYALLARQLWENGLSAWCSQGD
ncbi:MAG: hypothetical protein ACUVUC_00450 [Thermoguttaceae bacterium]